jgi:4-hydroxybenzoate polyprenyltransferase/phosphoserine phosphatase
MADPAVQSSDIGSQDIPGSVIIPVVVDLDGTLTRSDTLIEGVLNVIFKNYSALPGVILSLAKGRAHFKAQVAAAADLDFKTLPYDPDVTAFIERCRQDGADVHLVTAADQSIADGVSIASELFDTATGSQGGRNLKGAAKAAYAAERFPAGFCYVGDTYADLPVWRVAKVAVAVATPSKLARLRRLGFTPDAAIVRRGATARDWIKALRIHQWLKNGLIFVPLILAHAFTDGALLLRTLLGLLLFGGVASGTYLINDLSDLAADRSHPTKRRRPLASGRISATMASGVALALIGLCLIGATLISIKFLVVLASYLLITLAYSLRLKREPLIDILTIGCLFTLRVVAGMVLALQPISLWLSAFTLVLFTSLATAKRHAELVRLAASSGQGARGRGYLASDTPLTVAFGQSTAVTSILVVVLYLQLEAVKTGLYSNLKFLFLIPVVLASWLARIWIGAHRGLLDDDPVIFAIKDKVSWVHAAVVVALWFVAISKRLIFP